MAVVTTYIAIDFEAVGTHEPLPVAAGLAVAEFDEKRIHCSAESVLGSIKHVFGEHVADPTAFDTVDPADLTMVEFWDKKDPYTSQTIREKFMAHIALPACRRLPWKMW